MNQRRFLISYVAIAYAFTWACHFSIMFLGLSFSFDIGSLAMKLYLVGLAGPLVAAISVNAMRSGFQGVRKLLAKGVLWRFPLRWYLVAILAIPLINLLNVLIFHDKAAPDMGWFVVVPILIAGQLWVVIAEEYGWRGTALPALQSSLGALGATLILGPIWGLWHLPMFFIEGSPQYSENILSALPVYVAIITVVNIIFTMIYNRSGGSVLACMLLHASLNIAAFTIQVPVDANITMYLIAAAALVSIAFLDRPLFGRSAASSD